MFGNARTICPVGTKLRINKITHLGGYLIWNKSRHSTTQSKYLADLAEGDTLSFQHITPIAYSLCWVSVMVCLAIPKVCPTSIQSNC